MFSISVHSYVLGHAPLKPSPLTLCNSYAWQYSPSMAPFAKVASKVTDHKQRAKPRSLLLPRGGEQDRRRQVFLTKVKRNGDDRRWDSRADQILRNEFLSQQKRWEIEQARSAPTVPEEMEVELDPGSGPEKRVVDDVISQMDNEYEASMYLVEQAAKPTDDHELLTNEYGSEDENYDGLFMQLVSEVEGGDKGIDGCSTSARCPGQEMDMSAD